MEAYVKEVQDDLKMLKFWRNDVTPNELFVVERFSTARRRTSDSELISPDSCSSGQSHTNACPTMGNLKIM